MISSGVLVAVAMVLSVHGSEGTREEKFRGALLAQQAPEVRGSLSPDAKNELAALRADRPRFRASATLLIFGGAFSILGPTVVGLTIAFVASLREASVWFVVMGAGLFGLGVVLGVIGGIAMAVVGAELTRADARIRELEGLAPVQGATQDFAVPPRLVLARF